MELVGLGAETNGDRRPRPGLVDLPGHLRIGDEAETGIGDVLPHTLLAMVSRGTTSRSVQTWMNRP
jgi:hypothetical protein